VFAVGVAAGRVDVRRATLASALVVGASALGMGLAPGFPIYLAVLFVRGVATGPFRGLDRVVLSHLYPSGRARIFNLYAVVWALGATAGPIVVTAALGLGEWRYAYAVAGAGFLLSAALLYGVELPDSFANETAVSLSELRGIARRRPVVGMTAALALNGGIEGSLFTWLPTFAAAGLPDAAANLVLSTFLVAYVPARLFYSALTDRTGRTLDVVLVAVALSIPLLAAVLVVDGPPLYLAVFALGCTVSAVFPTLSAFGVERVPEHSGPVNALATSAGYLGIATVPALVGYLAGRTGLGDALWLLVGLLVLTLVVLLVTRRLGGPTAGAAPA
jgi:MFS family permease